MKNSCSNQQDAMSNVLTVRRLASVMTVSVILWTPSTFGNVVGSDMQLFNPTTDGIDYVTVESSETLLPGYVNFGLFMNYAVNTLPYFENDGQKQSRSRFNDKLLAADLNVGLGLLENLSLGLSLPQIVTQSVSTEGYNGKFRDNGNTEVRLNSKLNLIGESGREENSISGSGLAISGVVNLNRTKDNPYVGKTDAPVYTLQLIADHRVDRELAFGVNLGYRWRRAGTAIPESAPIKPLPNQIIGSAALSYLFESIDSKLILEVYGSRPAKKTDENGDRTASSSEALLGLKHDLMHDLALHGGMATELEHGLSTPDWRLYAGINYVIGPSTKDIKRVSSDTRRAAVNARPFAGPPKAYEKVVVHDILFEFDSDDKMVGSSKETLEQLAKYLVQPPLYTKLVVTGHTDSVGGTDYNDALSLNRALTIKRWLISQHRLDAAKIFAEGKGEREPVASNSNFQGRQLNRRVEFKIYRDQKVESFDPSKVK